MLKTTKPKKLFSEILPPPSLTAEIILPGSEIYTQQKNPVPLALSSPHRMTFVLGCPPILSHHNQLTLFYAILR